MVISLNNLLFFRVLRYGKAEIIPYCFASSRQNLRDRIFAVESGIIPLYSSIAMNYAVKPEALLNNPFSAPHRQNIMDFDSSLFSELFNNAKT